MGVRPEAVDKLRAWHCGHEGGEPVPQPIAERYAALPEGKRSLGLCIEVAGAGVAENKRQAEVIADRKERAERGIV